MGSRAVLQASGPHLDLIRAPYVLYGVNYIGLVSLPVTAGPSHIIFIKSNRRNVWIRDVF